MIRAARRILHQLAIRPLLLAAFVGGMLAWPLAVGPWWTVWASAAVVSTGASAFAELGPSVPGAWRRATSTVGLSVLLLMALGQRLDQPAFGLVAMMAFI